MRLERLLFALALLSVSFSASGTNVYPLGQRSVIYVSSIAANGVSLGVDAGCDGSPVFNPATNTGPCLTWDHAYGLMPPGGTMRLNGTLVSPQTYYSTKSTVVGGSPVSTIIDRAGTFEAVVPGSVNITSGTGTGQALAIGPLASSAVVNLNGINVRPDLNIAGMATTGLFQIGSPFAPLYTLNTTDVTFVCGTSSATAVQRTQFMSGVWTRPVGICGTAQAAFNFKNQNSGNSLTIIGGSCVISDMTTAGFGGCIHYQNLIGISNPAPTLTVTGFDVSATTAVTAGQFYGIRAVGAVGHISGGVHSCSGAGTSGCHQIDVGFSSDTAGLDISGSTIGPVTSITINANSGIPCIIGQDSIGDRTLNQNPVIDGCNATGSSTVEGPILGSAINGIIRNSTVTGMSLGVGAKDCLNCQFLNNTLTNISGLVLIDKGNTGSLFQGNVGLQTTAGGYSGLTIETNVDTGESISAITNASSGVVTVPNSAGYHIGDYVYFTSVGGMTQLNGNSYPITAVADATHFTVGVDTTGFGTYTSGGTSIIASSGGTYNLNTFTNNGATGSNYMLDWQAGNLINVLEFGTYQLLSGSTPFFRTPTATYTTCLLYQAAAVETSPTCVGF